MPKNLNSFELPALTDAIEFNMQEASTLWGHALGADFHHEPEASWFISNISHWFCNWVTKTQFRADTPPGTIDAFLKRLNEYKRPMFWNVDSSSSEDFLKRIESHGWKGVAVTAWALDIRTLDKSLAYPEGVTVEHVDSSKSLMQWIHAFVFGYPMPDYLYDHAVEILHRYGFVTSPGVHYYLGRFNGEPVTSTLLFLGGGVAGIYNTATLESARRHGVASAVIHKSLLDAQDMGYHIAALQASEMGQPVYERLGFREHGTINMYWLEPVQE